MLKSWQKRAEKDFEKKEKKRAWKEREIQWNQLIVLMMLVQSMIESYSHRENIWCQWGWIDDESGG